MAPINPRRTRAAAFKTERPVAAPMKAFRVTGIAPFGQQRQAFSMDLPATDAADAEHRVYSIMGSRHNATRRSIDLQSVTEIDPRTSQEPVVLHHFREDIAAAGGPLAPTEEE